ncbi:MAG TPA: hypothetical protein VJ728_08605, partial [Candidatus Binataceae bacterium]|nr:hypothetical protein [Candidatus Binataceae bacterium]
MFDSAASVFYVDDMAKKPPGKRSADSVSEERPEFAAAYDVKALLDTTLQRLGVPLWGYLLLIISGALFFWSPLPFESIFPRLNRIDSRLDAIDRHLERIDGRFDVLIPRLMKDSFSDAAGAANKGNADATVNALQDATVLLRDAAIRR